MIEYKISHPGPIILRTVNYIIIPWVYVKFEMVISQQGP